MTTHDPHRQNPEWGHDGPLSDDLVQLYQQAVGLEDARPSEQLRATVLAAALQKAQPVQRAGESASAGVAPSATVPVQRPAANDARWKLRAFGSLAVLGLVGLLASRFLPHTAGHEELAQTMPPAPYQQRAETGQAQQPQPAEPSVPETAGILQAEKAEAAAEQPAQSPAPAVPSHPSAKPDQTKKSTTSPTPPPTTRQNTPQSTPQAKAAPQEPSKVQQAELQPVQQAQQQMPAAGRAEAPVFSAPSPESAAVHSAPQPSVVAVPGARARSQSFAVGAAAHEGAPFPADAGQPSEPMVRRQAAPAPAVQVSPMAEADAAPQAMPGKSLTPMAEWAEAPATRQPMAPAPSAQDAAALLVAASRGDMQGVRRALQAGVPINSRDAAGRTALMRAAANGHVETVRYLLRHQANRELIDHAGRSAADHARLAGHENVVREILR